MKYRAKIESTFGAKIFDRPLFYNYEGALRFEMSEGGSFLNQFLTAHRKGMEVCNEIFDEDKELTICLKIFGNRSLLSCLSTLRSLRDFEIYSKGYIKEHWTEKDEEWEDESEEDFRWHYLVLEMPSSSLLNILWCAFSSDFGLIQPASPAALYIFEFHKKIAVLPYDDRGMDIVGTNSVFLKALYESFEKYLLDYDREEMDRHYA